MKLANLNVSELNSKLEILIAKRDEEFAARDEQIAKENELLANHHDTQATELDCCVSLVRRELWDRESA